MTYFNGVIVFIGKNLAEYIFILAVISLIYFMVYRKIIDDIFDPLLMMVVGQVFAVSTVAIMAIGGLATNYLNIALATLCLVAFNIGATNCFTARKMNKKNSRRDLRNNYSSIADSNFIFYILILCYFSIKVMIFIVYGSAGSYENHVQYSDVTKKISIFHNILSFVVMFISFKRFCDGKKWLSSLFFLIFIFTGISSGAKSSLLSIGICLYFYKLYFGAEVTVKRLYKVAIMLAVFGVFYTIIVTTQSKDYYNVVLHLMTRFVGFGDGYAYAFYSDSTLLERLMEENNAYTLLINPILSMIGLTERVANNQALGNQLVDIAYNVSGVTTNGPNTRFVLFFMVAFGKWFSVFASFFLGKIIYILRKKVFKRNGSIISYLIIVNIYTTVISAVSDPGYAYYQLWFLVIFIMFFGILIGTIKNRRLSIILPKL